MDHELTVRFTHSNTVRDKKPYTIYEIEVRSSSTITWVIYKRYSAFYALHQELSKAHASHPHIRLPHLPPKRLTRSLAAEFVEKRKQELQEYLREILASAELLHSPVILSFLEVPDSVKPMLARTPSTNHMYPGFDLKDMSEEAKARLLSSKADYQHKSYEERRVLELINLLKYHPNKVAAIKNFEEYFFQTRPRLSNEFIQMLFQGRPGTDAEGGLVQCCGDFQYSHVASRGALYLLCRLLDVEKNKDAQLYLDQFTSLPLSVLGQMQLHLHILSERGNRLGAFRIVQVLRNAHKGHFSIEDIVADTWARQEYFRWVERKTDHVSRFGKEPQDVALKAVSLDSNHRTVAQTMFQDILKVAKNQQDWRTVTPVESYDPVEAERSALLAHVGVAYKVDPSRELTVVRVSTVLPFEVDAVAELLLDLSMQSHWDPRFVQGKVLHQEDRVSDVVHKVFKSYSSPYKYRDFVLFRSHTKLDGGGRLLGSRSVHHARGPEFKDNVRAVLLPTGYIITQAGQPQKGGLTSATGHYSMLTYIAQMDHEAVLTVAPDLLGETQQLSQGIANINTVLARQQAATRGTNAAPPAMSISVTSPSVASPVGVV